MSFLDNFVPNKQKQLGNYEPWWYGIFGNDNTETVNRRSLSGVRVTDTTALTFSACWGATYKIASTLASLPCQLLEEGEGQGWNRVRGDNRAYLVNERPNPDMDAFVFWEMMIASLVNCGNAYAEKQYINGKLAALWPVHASRVRPDYEDDGTLFWVVEGNVKKDGKSEAERIEAADMLNLVGPHSTDGVIGKGVFDFALESIGLGIADAQFLAAYFGNGASPSFVLESEAKIDRKARMNYRREWNDNHQGGHNAGKIGILGHGLKYKAISADPQQAQAIETMTFSIQEMARWYDLPPHIIGDLTHATFSNIDATNRALVVQHYTPRLCRIEKRLDLQILPAKEAESKFFKFNVNEILRGDPKQHAEINQIEFMNGFKNQDEVRAEHHMPALDDDEGKVHYHPVNLTANGEQPEEPEPAPIPDVPPVKEAPSAPPAEEPLSNVPFVALLRDTIQSNAQRIIKIESASIRSISNKTREWDDWIGPHCEKIERLLSDALTAPAEAAANLQIHINAKQAARAYVEQSRAALDELYVKPGLTREEFSERLTVMAKAWENWRAHELAERLIT